LSDPEEAAFLRSTIRRLPNGRCNGCYDCATRCMGNLPITRTEFEAIREFIGGGGYFPTVRPAGGMAAACEFADPDGPRCLIYPVRPLICRLFGLVEWLPCPRGRLGVLLPDGVELIRRYSRFERRTYRQWLRNSSAAGRGIASKLVIASKLMSGRPQRGSHGTGQQQHHH